MFRNLSDPVKAGAFYALAFGLALAVTFLSQRLGEGVLLISMFTPLMAVLIMFFVVTSDGYSKAGWLSLGLHRAGLRSWGLAVLMPLLAIGGAYGAAWIIGVGQPTCRSQALFASIQTAHLHRHRRCSAHWAKK
jgi:hypothetical protein